LLTAFGFVLFAAGLGLSTNQTIAADYDAMLWPQILRGIGIMFCLVPTTRLALGLLAAADVADGSGLFNLSRNLGGAIGLALIDTLLYGRAPVIGAGIEAGLKAHDLGAAAQIGVTAAQIAHQGSTPLDSHTLAFVHTLIGKAALAQAMNEVWGVLAILTCVASLAVLRAKGFDGLAKYPPEHDELGLKRLRFPSP
jgi:DHA2 family multidrug resistance protein